MVLLQGCKRSAVMFLALLAAAALVAAACTTDDADAPTAAPPAPVVVQQGPSAVQQTGIWVDGAGSVTAEPDVANLSFGVEARADTVAPARAEAASAMDAVIASLRGNGVADRDIQTSYFSIEPITVYEEGKNGERTPKIVGYRVVNFATATIREVDNVGSVIDDAAEAGGDAIRINGIGFSVDDPRPLEVEARKLALEDATAKAEQIASVMNVTLGEPIYVSQQGGSPVVFRAAVPEAMFASDAATSISAGEQEIRIWVQVVFAIE